MTGAMVSPAFTLRIRADLQCLAYVRLVLRRTLPDLDETTDALYYGAVTEIVSNAINAQAEAQREDPIQIRVYRRPRPAIEIIDTGGGFDPLDPPTSVGGFGLQIARSVCPDITIESSTNGTAVTLPYPAMT